MVYQNVTNIRSMKKENELPDLFSQVQMDKQHQLHKQMRDLEFCIACGEVFSLQDNAVLCPDCITDSYPGVKLAWKFERDEL